MYSDVARNNKMVKNAYSGKLMLKYVLYLKFINLVQMNNYWLMSCSPS